MWAWLLLCLAIVHPSKPYQYNNVEASSILDRLMSPDYLDQEAPMNDRVQQRPRAPFSELPDYPLYEDLAPRPRYQAPVHVDYPDIAGPATYNLAPPEQPRTPHVQINQAKHDAQHPVPSSSQHKLQFPKLSAKQKQFAVSPGQPEYYAEHPDFLQFRLQELEEDQKGAKQPEQLEKKDEQPSHTQDQELEHQLEAMTGNIPHGEQSDSKRGLLGGGVRAEPLISGEFGEYGEEERSDDLFFTTIIAVSTAASVFAVIGAGFCYHRTSGRAKEQEEVEYPAYGVTGPAKEASPAGDRKLAQSAQMYHYQHQKNQMIAINRGNGGPGNNSGGEESDGEMEGEGEEGDYTVYECPGLASTDEMEVKNPLFNDDPTPKNP